MSRNCVTLDVSYHTCAQLIFSMQTQFREVCKRLDKFEKAIFSLNEKCDLLLSKVASPKQVGKTLGYVFLVTLGNFFIVNLQIITAATNIKTEQKAKCISIQHELSDEQKAKYISVSMILQNFSPELILICFELYRRVG